MKITQETDYALRVVLYLSKLGYGQKIEAKVIAQKESLPLRFLLKLLRKLIKANIIISFRGVNGGYALNKEPKDITLKDIIEAIEGPIYLNRCIYDTQYCSAGKKGNCEVHKALCKVQSNLIKDLEKVNFKSLLENNK